MHYYGWDFPLDTARNFSLKSIQKGYSEKEIKNKIIDEFRL